MSLNQLIIEGKFVIGQVNHFYSIFHVFILAIKYCVKHALRVDYQFSPIKISELCQS